MFYKGARSKDVIQLKHRQKYQQFTEKKMKKGFKRIKRCITFLKITEMQIKVIMRYDSPSIKLESVFRKQTCILGGEIVNVISKC